MKLHKYNVALSFHHVCEAIAAKIIAFFHIPGEINLVDVLSKHWGFQQVWGPLQALLFWPGIPMSSLVMKKRRRQIMVAIVIPGAHLSEARSHAYSYGEIGR